MCKAFFPPLKIKVLKTNVKLPVICSVGEQKWPKTPQTEKSDADELVQVL